MFKNLSGLFLLFGIVMLICFGLKDELLKWKIDYKVVVAGNALLFILSVVSILLHTRALTNPNPNVFVRSVMLSNVMKILVITAAAVIYVVTTGKEKASTNAIFAVLFLYIVYSWIEKRAAIRLSKTRKV